MRIPLQTDQGVSPPCRARATRDNFVVACATLHRFIHPWRWYLANRRLSMRKIREVLRLAFGAGLELRKIERSLGISHATVSNYVDTVAWDIPRLRCRTTS